MNQRFCQNELRSARRPGGRTAVLGDKFNLHNSFLCAGGGENSDTCTGDGGSPLVCALNEKKDGAKRYVQVKVFHWSSNKGRQNNPFIVDLCYPSILFSC